MKRILSIFILFVSLSASAQIYPDGTVISSFSATDINNNFFSSTMATNSGKHIIIDISATWCGICWSYHNTKVLDDYNAKYGASGTDLQDAEVIFYEGDAATTTNDLNGIGTNTVGDWVTGTNYRIFDEANPSNVKSSFSASGTLGYPSVFVVCNDNKMYRVSTSLNTVTALRGFVDSKCGTAPLSASTVHSASFAYDLFPNPVQDNLNIKIDLDRVSKVSYTLSNSLGQQMLVQDLGLQEGAVQLKLQTANLAQGLYILNLVVGSERITEKVLIQQ